MMMLLIAASLGLSILVVIKAVLGSLLSLSLYKVNQLHRFCCRKRDGYRELAEQQKMGLRGSNTL